MTNNTRNVYARPPSVLETDRLLLRAPKIEDAFDLQALAERDDSFAQSTIGTNPNTIYGNCTAIARMVDDRRKGTGAWWVVEDKTSSRIIGIVGYSDRAPSEGIACTLAQAYVGQGYTGETIAALLQLGRASYGLHPDAISDMASKPTAAKSGAHWVWQCKATQNNLELTCA